MSILIRKSAYFRAVFDRMRKPSFTALTLFIGLAML